MTTAARRRLMRDFKRLQEDPPAGVSGAPGENNIMVWNAVIFGPHDTPFEDGTFKLTMGKPKSHLVGAFSACAELGHAFHACSSEEKTRNRSRGL